MMLVLIAAVALGLGTAGLVLSLPRLLGVRPPRWVAPAAGGLAMFAFMLWNEYTWYDRAAAALPEGVVVAETYPYAHWAQPWTLAVPRVVRYAAVDLATARRHADRPEAVLADVMLVERFAGSVRVPQLFDCAGGRRALPPEEPSADWSTLEWRGAPDDPLIRAACNAEIAPDGA